MAVDEMKNYAMQSLGEIKNEESKNQVQDYVFEKRSDGIKWGTIKEYTRVLKELANRYPEKSLEELERKEIIRHIAHLADRIKQSTLVGYKVGIKNFYKYQNGGENYPDKVKGISTSRRALTRKEPDTLLSPDEIKQIIETCTHPRDKALIAVLYESGMRLGEFISLNLRNVEPDRYGTVIRLNPDHDSLKTGTRRVRLVKSDPYLRNWINNHPRKDEPDAPLWVTIGPSINGTRIGEAGVRKHIQRLAKRADINKRIYPHLFRHSRATELAKEGFTEQDMKIMLGWTKDSDMPATYIHMAGGDVEQKLLRFHGLLDGEDQEPTDPLEPWTCDRCGNRNGTDIHFCGTCGLARTIKDAEKVEKAEGRTMEDINFLMQAHPEVKEEINNFVQDAIQSAMANMKKKQETPIAEE